MALLITLYGIFAEDMQFSSTSLVVEPTEVTIGQTFLITSTIGGNGNEIINGQPFVFSIDNTNIDFPNFNDKGIYSISLPNGKVMNYYIEYFDDRTVITSDPFNQGETLSIQFKGVFNTETTKNKEVANISLIYNGNTIKHAEFTAKTELNWENTKTGPESITILKNDADYIIDGELKYSITGSQPYTNIENKPVDSIVTSIAYRDKIKLPDGLFFKQCPTGQDEQAYLMAALGIESLKDKNLNMIPTYTDDGNISSVLFTWNEVTAQDFSYEFILNNQCLTTSEAIISSKITNTLDSTCSTKLGSSIETEPVSVDTLVNVKDIADYVDSFSKKIINTTAPTMTLDEWGNAYGYMIEEDYVLYEITYKYKGPSVDKITLKDILPEELVPITKNELRNLFFIKDNTEYPEIYGSSYPDYDAYQDENGNISWDFYSVEKDTEIKAYIYARVNSNVNKWIKNNAQIVDKTASVSSELKAKNESVGLEKTNSFNGIEAGKKFFYTIKIRNTGTVDVFNRTLSDMLPEEVSYISSEVVYTGTNSSMGKLTYANGTITASDINITEGEYIEVKVNVKIKDNVTVSQFVNTAYIYNNDKIEKEASVYNKYQESQTPSKGDVEFNKTVDKTVVAPGEEITYNITLYNNSSESIDLSKEPYVITDNIPLELNYISASYTKSQTYGTTFTDGIDVKDNILNWTYSGNIKAYETIKLTIICHVKAEDGLTSSVINNTAFLGDISQSVTTAIVKPEDELKVEKTPILADGTEVVNNEINQDELLTFRIKVENPSSSNSSYYNLDYVDKITKYMLNATCSSGILNINVVDKNDKVKGFTEIGDTLVLKNMWSDYTTSFKFNITNDITKKNNSSTIYYNEEFELQPGGYIVLEYALKVPSDCLTLINEITVNDRYKDDTGLLKTEKTSNISLEKESVTKVIAIDDIKGYEFQYNIKVSNTSLNNDASLSQFTVTDIIPEGMELCPRWYGDSGFTCDVFYSAYNSNLWSDSKGGQYYTHIVNGNLVVEFGSTSDSGTQTLLNLKKDEYYIIKIKLRFKDAAANEILSQTLNPSGITKTNTVKLTSPSEIKNSNGDVVTELEASDLFKIMPTTIHPGLTKSAVGYYSGKYKDGYVEYDDTTSQNITPGDTIIWRIEITNPVISTRNKTLKNFKVKDIIPSHYTYDWDRKLSTDEIYILKLVHKNGTETILDYFDPAKIDEKTIEWSFNDEKYDIFPDDKLVIEFPLVNDGTNSFGLCTNYTELSGEDKYDSSTITNGSPTEDGGILNSCSINIALYKTSSYKQITALYNNVEQETAFGNKEDNNTVHGYTGDYVKYNLHIENESTTRLSNLVAIDRLPYIGDIGVITEYNRNSQFSVNFDKLLSVTIENADGIVEDITNSITLMFSNNSIDTFRDTAIDWDGVSDDVASWHSNYEEGDCNVRFTFNDVIINPNSKINICFTGYIPDNIDVTNEQSCAWNNFGYCYTNIKGNSNRMIAEPAKVGVWVNPTEKSTKYSILINKINTNKDPLSNVQFKLVNKDTLKEYYDITDENGSLLFNNLPEGNYILTETRAAVGYELLKDSIEITLNSNTTTDLIYSITIENEPIIKMPATGGISPFIHFLIGMIIVIMIILLLKHIKRQNYKKGIEI